MRFPDGLVQRRQRCLGSDERDKRFSNRINAQVEALQSEGSNQNQIGRTSAEDDRGSHFPIDENFSRGYRFRDNHPIGVLDPTGAEGSHSDLLEELTGHLGKMGSSVYQPLELKRARRIAWISDGKFHVERSHVRVILVASLRAVNTLAVPVERSGTGSGRVYTLTSSGMEGVNGLLVVLAA